MKLALGQLDIMWEDKPHNKQKIEKFLYEASGAGSDLLLLPEMSLTGFSMNTSSLSEFRDGETTDWFKKQATKANINIGFGYIEKDTSIEKCRNNYAIVNIHGDLVSIFSKIHPFSFGKESLHFEGGNTISVYKLDEWSISSFICYDLRFPEIFQAASRDAHLIIVAANWPGSRINHWEALLRARAIENQCYIAGINRVGVGDGIQYSGASMVIDPLGNIIAKGGTDEELVICDIDIDSVYNIREQFKLKADRREDLYCRLYNKTFGDDKC